MDLTGTGYHPNFGGVVEYQGIPLSQDHETQVAQTIGLMGQFSTEDAKSWPILRDARDMAAVGSGDPLTDAFWWAKSRIQFQPDEDTASPFRSAFDDDVVEVLIRPAVIADMEAPVEDCDGFSSYVRSLAAAKGIPCRFVTVAADERDPDRYSHVYLACYPPDGERVAIDASHGQYPGWEAPNLYGKKKEWADGIDWRDIGNLLVGLAAAVALLMAMGVIK